VNPLKRIAFEVTGFLSLPFLLISLLLLAPFVFWSVWEQQISREEKKRTWIMRVMALVDYSDR